MGLFGVVEGYTYGTSTSTKEVLNMHSKSTPNEGPQFSV